MNPRCLCCDKMLGPFCFDGLCETCVGGTIRDGLFLRDGTVEQVKMRVAWLLDQRCPTLAKLAMGPIPFDAQPDAATLERLSDE